jgi:hypothetical protein
MPTSTSSQTVSRVLNEVRERKLIEYNNDLILVLLLLRLYIHSLMWINNFSLTGTADAVLQNFHCFF